MHVKLNVNIPNKHKAVEARRSELRKQFNVPEMSFVFIFLGRLHPEKGLKRAVDTFHEFSKGFDGDTFFLIIGRDDGMQREIKDYIRSLNLNSLIRIVNNVYESRFDYYLLSDIFIGFPTIYEETMLASLEALS